MDRQERARVLSTFRQPKLLSRMAAFAIDAAFFVLLGLALSMVGSYFASLPDGKLAADNALENEHIASSGLSYYDSSRGYLSYETEDLLSFDGEELEFTSVLSHYYLSYLTGNGLGEGETASLNHDVPLKDGALPEDYYTVSWFNLNILKTGQEGSYFVSGGDDARILGSLSPDYYEVTEQDGESRRTVVEDSGLQSYVKKTYQTAVKHFFAQDFIHRASSEISLINSLVLFGAMSLSLAVFYVLIPCLSRHGRTLGKRFMGLILVTSDGFYVKGYRNLLRAVPLFACVLILCFISVIYYQIISLLVVGLVSLTLSTFTPYRQALHDFTAGTIVMSRENAIVCSGKEDFDKVFLTEKTEEKDGK